MLVSIACTSSPKPGATALEPAESMREILESHSRLAPVTARAAELRLQAVLGTIEPGPDGSSRLVQHGFRLGAEYFYPASTVKLFAAVAALERLGEIAHHRSRRRPGHSAGLSSTSSPAKSAKRAIPPTSQVARSRCATRSASCSWSPTTPRSTGSTSWPARMVWPRPCAAPGCARRASSIACRKRAAPKRIGATRGSISSAPTSCTRCPSAPRSHSLRHRRKSGCPDSKSGARTSRTASASRTDGFLDQEHVPPRRAPARPAGSCAQTSTAVGERHSRSATPIAHSSSRR